MGYFDGLTSASFKTTQDGHRLFFPWGVLGSGYAIASEQDYLRLRQQVKGFMIVSLVLVIGSGSFEGYFVPVVLGGVLIAFYLAWMWHLLRRLKVSGERMSLQESMTSQAHAFGAVVLWLLGIVAFACVGAGIYMLVVDPSQWRVALAAILISGLCVAKIARMLVLRRRTTGVKPTSS